ncbi:hypothetical protein PO185_01160 [Limosilactobacillus mucosae]|uniref:hypothetical protein n=1 Tax=Limosilactobacillus mucosae TaxID=97478 RepID=UPI00233EC51C|nr:hypothetical protein [Limosilactobacillus mucosae]MDC2844307.1 hypothetical protein [Limosilactobacillus mucosae]
MAENLAYNSFPQNLTGIPLPPIKYITLLGTSMSVFDYNNELIIEILINSGSKYTWHDLTDKESGQFKKEVFKILGSKIGNKFSELINMRNRIIHGYRVTKDDKQILATKDRKTQEQFYITEEYLYQFIEKNDELCHMLIDYRGY